MRVICGTIPVFERPKVQSSISILPFLVFSTHARQANLNEQSLISLTIIYGTYGTYECTVEEEEDDFYML